MPAQRRIFSYFGGEPRIAPATALSVQADSCLQRATSFASRNELFAGLVLLGFANGISERITSSLANDGFIAALLQSFDISVIVWSACAIGLVFLLEGPAHPIRRSDWVIAACALVAFLMPIPPLSWIALSAVSIHFMRGSPRASSLHRGASIVLAMTLPMFWGRLIFAMLSDFILRCDAMLVASVIGTQRLGNAVQFADGSGYLWIAPACSSVTNVSLAILCWVVVSKVSSHTSSLRDVAWVLAACSAVVAINVTRISLIGLHPEYFELIHGPVGLAIASWSILGATAGICLFGVRHDLSIGA